MKVQTEGRPLDKRRRIRVEPYQKGYEIWINNSSVNVIQSCKRKAMYALRDQLVPDRESKHLVYGKAIHKAMELYYLGESESTVLAAFKKEAESLSYLEMHEPESPMNGEQLVKKYMDFWNKVGQPWELYQDQDGPFSEREFEFVLLDSPNLKINYFGAIDALFKHKDTGELWAWDFKTTSQLGERWLNSHKPNAQFTGYLWAIRNGFGVPVEGLVMEGIQKKNLIPKTTRPIGDPQFLRVETDRSEAEIAEWRQSVVNCAVDWVSALEAKKFPMSCGSCYQYSGCQYLDICKSDPQFRQTVIDSKYRKED